MNPFHFLKKHQNRCTLMVSSRPKLGTRPVLYCSLQFSLWCGVAHMVRRGWLVRRGSIGSASACWKAGPSSIPGSAPQGGLSHWAISDEEMENGLGECIVWMWLDDCTVWMLKTKYIYINKQKEFSTDFLTQKEYFSRLMPVCVGLIIIAACT